MITKCITRLFLLFKIGKQQSRNNKLYKGANMKKKNANRYKNKNQVTMAFLSVECMRLRKEFWSSTSRKLLLSE